MNKTNWDKDFEERFWEKVSIPDNEKNECWLWTSATNNKHYGIFHNISNNNNDYKYSYAHRLAYEYYHGELTPDQLISHSCKNKLCMNPYHLILTDRKSLSSKRIENNTSPKGAKNGRAVITELEVKELRFKFDEGTHTIKQLSEEYGIGWTTTKHIIKRNTWKHI